MNKKLPTGKKHDVRDVESCTCANLRKATRVVTQAYDAALRPSGLKSTQFSLLAALAKLGDTPLTRLADALVMDRTTLTRNLEPLIRRKLIRTEQEKDQRVRKIGLTKAGRRVFEKALPQWEQMQLQISEKLGRERWSGFLDDLAATVTAFKNR